MTFSKEDKTFLINLARNTIIKKTKKVWLTEEEIKKLPDFLKEKKGCFVTLNKKGQLRGCIGYIMPIIPLYQAIIENAYNAAYGDPRFLPVTQNEIKDLEIEITILTEPEKLEYKTINELLEKLIPEKHGVIIKKGFFSATFLPQVWEQLPDKKDFLSHLCMKAGLNPNEWQKGTLEVETYEGIIIEEE
ncbi:MAG TPA: AmmeMemoRadiSam system protein A [Spirochaetota bacterium]|nr:AmmeMemoRadiSam system protein A [Spirochaetota bacterium]HOL55984.1 AmmeMemoRadiSam system protein A [Spirochaetota bacterium]HPP03426.1 AmmeMemoRadiSam system protein A [Spirochaetota bacterium]